MYCVVFDACDVVVADCDSESAKPMPDLASYAYKPDRGCNKKQHPHHYSPYH